MLFRDERERGRFGWFGGGSMIIGSIIVGVTAPVQFYRITTIEGLVDFNDPVYLTFFWLIILTGLSAPIKTISVVYSSSDLKDRIELRWYNFLLSRPLVKDKLSRESRQLSIRIEKLIQQVTELESRPAQTVEVVKIVEKPVIVEVERIVEKPVEVTRIVERVISSETISDEEARAKEIVSAISIRTSPGFIYVMRREDGVFKVGRTNDTERRLAQHRSDYKAQFELICRFVVPDVFQFEHLALRLTNQFSYAEEGRNELRKMTDSELEDFVLLFHRCCIMVVDR